MRNFKMILQYEGTKYQGWQRQESTGNTIQGKLEAVLTKMTGQPVEVQGSGRTDAGVHAMGQVANFKSDTTKSPREILEYINRYLPEDIAVIELTEAGERFHSRLNAKGKMYRYRILNSDIPSVFDRKYVYQLSDKLDIEAMRRGAAYLCGEHDFQAFTSAKKGKKSTVRVIEYIKIESLKDEIQFTFKGNGFLYHMVRIITGTLLEVGKGTIKAEAVAKILESKDRQKAGPLVPGNGLTLMEVFYE